MSTLTPNLQLIKPSGTDNVNIDNLNENFDILDSAINELKTDYVIAQGIFDKWTYRRWASGICECWGTLTIKNANNFAAGGVFELPVSFSQIDIVTATIGNGGFWNSYKSLDINIKAWSGTSTSITLWANSKEAAFETYPSVPVSVEVKGTWK